MGSHSVTCHPTQVNSPHLIPVREASTRLNHLVGIEGWVDLGGWVHTEIVNAAIKPLAVFWCMWMTDRAGQQWDEVRWHLGRVPPQGNTYAVHWQPGQDRRQGPPAWHVHQVWTHCGQSLFPCFTCIGHTRLTHQYLFLREEPPQCPSSCNCALTGVHIILDCQQYNSVRQKYLSVTTLKELLDRVNFDYILSFLRDIHLYSALEADFSALMLYINSRFTYLLTYCTVPYRFSLVL